MRRAPSRVRTTPGAPRASFATSRGRSQPPERPRAHAMSGELPGNPQPPLGVIGALPCRSRGQDLRGVGAGDRGDRGDRRDLVFCRRLERRVHLARERPEQAEGAPQQVLRRAAGRHVRRDRGQGGLLRPAPGEAEPAPRHPAPSGEWLRQPGSQRVRGAARSRLSGHAPSRFRCASLAVIATLGLIPAATAHASSPKPPALEARQWILIDTSDRARLLGHEVSTSNPMASTTKLMTAYLTLHKLPLEKKLTAPPYHPISGESLLGLKAGERMSVRDLLYGLLLPSGNDSAVTLADGVAGSTPAFVGEMNRAARRLGLRGTSFANPVGLDEPGNYSSPLDLAKLALRLRRERVFRRIVDTKRATLKTGAHPRRIVNRNDLVLEVPWINGVKTGYTLDAGHVLVGSGTRKGVTLLSVVMGAPSISARDADTLGLLRYGFSLYRRQTPVSEGETLAHRTVPNGD